MKKVVAGLDPVTVAAMLRARVFTIKSQDIGLPAADCPPVWGLVLDLGFSASVASLVVLLDGSVSVYLSDSGGVIGCGLHPEVRSAARKMLLLAQGMTASCQPLASYPLPAESQVHCYLLTPSGIVGARADKAVLDDGAVELAELYYAAHGLIDIIELLGAGVDLVDEMRLAQSKTLQDGAAAANESSDDISGTPLSEFQARGRAWRILPYAGGAARRLRN